MSGFNSFGDAGFGQPAPFGTGHDQTKTFSYAPPAPVIEGPSPDQIIQLAGHAIEKHNQGLPLNDQEKWAIEQYQHMLSSQAPDGSPQQGDPAGQAMPVANPAAVPQTFAEKLQAAMTPKNIAIGVGLVVAVSALSASGKSS